MQFVVYYANGTDPDPAYDTGEIVRTQWFEDEDDADDGVGAGPADFTAAAPPYCSWILDPTETANTETHYVSTAGTPALTARPVLTAETSFVIHADGVDEVRIPLPAGTEMVNHFTYARSTNAIAEDFVFTTQINGEWSFLFTPPFPRAPVIIEISA